MHWRIYQGRSHHGHAGAAVLHLHNSTSPRLQYTVCSTVGFCTVAELFLEISSAMNILIILLVLYCGGGMVVLQLCIRNTGPLGERDSSFFKIFRHDSLSSALHSAVHQCKFALKPILHRILLHFTASGGLWAQVAALHLISYCILSPTINLNNIQTRQHLHMLWLRISFV